MDNDAERPNVASLPRPLGSFDMEHEQFEKTVARRSALIYLPISLGAAIVFLIAASVLEDYPTVARIGGTVWITVLSLIISMPLVTARIKKHVRTKSSLM